MGSGREGIAVIGVVDWLVAATGWGQRGVDRSRGLIRSARPSVVTSEGPSPRSLRAVWLFRRSETDPASAHNARAAAHGAAAGRRMPFQPDGADPHAWEPEPAPGVEDPDHDRAMMRRVREQDPAALATLYDRYAAQVNGLALSIVRNAALAEEVTHDVFLRVWHQPTAYDPARGTFAGWLFRVTRNRAIDLLRRRREHSIEALAGEATLGIADPEPGPEEQALTRLRRQEVRLALETLPPEHRRLIELAYDTGLSQSQIAAHLGRPLGTVKSQIRAAMTALAERLAPVAGGTQGDPE